jgi:hypothetical protein
MIEAMPPEEVQRNANRIGEAMRANLYHMVDVLEQHAETQEVDVVGIMRDTTAIKFVRPTSDLVNNLMRQFGVLFVQVIPADPKSVLSYIMEQGYHVVPQDQLATWKATVLQHHKTTVDTILHDLTTVEDEDAVEDEDTAQPIVGDPPPSHGEEV